MMTGIVKNDKKVFGHLPDEIWCLILDQVKDSTGLESCFRTCKQLNRLLQSRQSIWLFGKALPHIYPYLDRKDVLGCRRVCMPWCEDIDAFLSSNYELVPYDKELHPRRESIPEVHWTGSHFGSWIQGPEYMWTCSMVKIDTISKFLIKFGMDHTTEPSSSMAVEKRRTPFIGRSIVVFPYRKHKARMHDFDDVGSIWDIPIPAGMEEIRGMFFTRLDEAQYWRMVKLSLRWFGYDVHHLSFCGYSSLYRFSYSSYLNHLKDCLSLLPNLKTLNLKADHVWEEDDLPAALAQLILPRLPHLITLRLTRNYEKSNPLLAYLIEQYADTLVRLDISGNTDKLVLSKDIRETLSLKELNFTPKYNNILETRRLLELISKSPLEKLSITWAWEFGKAEHVDYFEETCGLMEQISGFGSTLLSLKLVPRSCGHPREPDDKLCKQQPHQTVAYKCTPSLHQSIQNFLQLPHVHSLELRGYLDGSIDFILQLPALARFIWRPQFYNKHCAYQLNKCCCNKTKIIDLDQHVKGIFSSKRGEPQSISILNQVYKSNIWKVHRSLQNVSVVKVTSFFGMYSRRIYCFSRQKYEFLQTGDGDAVGQNEML